SPTKPRTVAYRSTSAARHPSSSSPAPAGNNSARVARASTSSARGTARSISAHTSVRVILPSPTGTAEVSMSTPSAAASLVGAAHPSRPVPQRLEARAAPLARLDEHLEAAAQRGGDGPGQRLIRPFGLPGADFGHQPGQGGGARQQNSLADQPEHRPVEERPGS